MDGAPGEITPGILPYALRAVLRTFKIVPDDFVELGVRTNSSESPSMKKPAFRRVHLWMARLERFELPTARFVAEYSIQLSYRRFIEGAILRIS